jgi:hypothetical protein
MLRAAAQQPGWAEKTPTAARTCPQQQQLQRSCSSKWLQQQQRQGHNSRMLLPALLWRLPLLALVVVCQQLCMRWAAGVLHASCGCLLLKQQQRLSPLQPQLPAAQQLVQTAPVAWPASALQQQVMLCPQSRRRRSSSSIQRRLHL